MCLVKHCKTSSYQEDHMENIAMQMFCFLVNTKQSYFSFHRFVLRNFIAQSAIEAAENGNFSVVSNSNN